MELVLDCSVLCGFIFANQRTAYTLQVADTLRRQRGRVPSLCIAEISNVLRTQERRGHIQPKEAESLIEGIAALPLTVEDMTSMQQGAALLTLAREHLLSAYDATYLALAIRYGIPLATRDEALKRAAMTLGLFFDEKREVLRDRS